MGFTLGVALTFSQELLVLHKVHGVYLSVTHQATDSAPNQSEESRKKVAQTLGGPFERFPGEAKVIALQNCMTF